MPNHIYLDRRDLKDIYICKLPNYSEENFYQTFDWIEYHPTDFIFNKTSEGDTFTIAFRIPYGSVTRDVFKKDEKYGMCYLGQDTQSATIMQIKIISVIDDFECGCYRLKFTARIEAPSKRIGGLMIASAKRFANPMGIVPRFSSERKNYMPYIRKVIINDPSVVVVWSDGSKTVAKCMDGEVFNPEIGLAMAISKKYYINTGSPQPRAAFKNELKNAEDYSKATKKRRDRKKANG